MSLTTAPTTAPEFVTPTDITHMSNEVIDALIEGIRHRRMQSRVIYERTKALKDEAANKKLEAQFEKKMEKLYEQLNKFEKHFEKLEKSANEVRALRLQLGHDPL